MAGPALSALSILSALCLGACAPGVLRPVSPRYALTDPDPAKKLRAIRQVAAAGDTRYVDQLIELLEDRDATVRFVAGKALGRLTGRRTTTTAFDGPQAHQDEAAAWRAWRAGPFVPGSNHDR